MRKMREETISVKSLEDYLFRVIQPIVKNPKLLRTGRQFRQIKLRPREILGAFVVCAVARYLSNEEWTLASDTEDGDGIVYRKGGEDGYFLEQVYVFPRKFKTLSSDQITQEIKDQLAKKLNNGKNYANYRHLVIFLDATGKLDQQTVKRYIDKIDGYFDSYWLFARDSFESGVFSYIVFLLKAPKDEPSAFRITLNTDFKGWNVQRLGKI